jgi:hypothetical protein
MANSIQSAVEVDMGAQLTAIAVDKIVKPDAVSYTYKAWLYVDNRQTTDNTDKTIFNRDEDLALTLNRSTSTLKLTIKRPTVTPTTDTTHTITTNFPLQKWVYVVISVDGSTIDMYLDGKLVKSVKDTHTVNKDKTITFEKNDGMYMSKFNRVVKATNPQTVWSEYLSGSGSSFGLSSLASEYSVNLTLLENNIISKSVSLW